MVFGQAGNWITGLCRLCVPCLVSVTVRRFGERPSTVVLVLVFSRKTNEKRGPSSRAFSVTRRLNPQLELAGRNGLVRNEVIGTKACAELCGIAPFLPHTDWSRSRTITRIACRVTAPNHIDGSAAV